MSLRAYLAGLVERFLTPAERTAPAERARTVLKLWNGYDPSPEDEVRLDKELDRRIAEAAR
jgi:hypothetical protein